jgi:hypothetical protein
MLPILVLAASIAAVWRFGVWPFSRSFKYLPSYSQICQNKTATSCAKAQVVAPPRPSV